MDYEGYTSAVCDAEESDWLDISYTQRKYIDKAAAPRARFPKIKLKFKKVWMYAAIALLGVAVLAGLLFVDGNFTSDVFNAVKTANASIFTRPQDVTENKVNIPCNLTLTGIEDGVMTFSGGRIALSLTNGTVTDVNEDTVTVALDDDTYVVYYQLDEVMVSVGDNITESALLGKYSDEFSACIFRDGQVVKEVIGSESQLTWSV